MYILRFGKNTFLTICSKSFKNISKNKKDIQVLVKEFVFKNMYILNFQDQIFCQFPRKRYSVRFPGPNILLGSQDQILSQVPGTKYFVRFSGPNLLLDSRDQIFCSVPGTKAKFACRDNERTYKKRVPLRTFQNLSSLSSKIRT